MLVESPQVDRLKSRQILDELNSKLLQSFIEEKRNVNPSATTAPDYDKCVKIALKALKKDLTELNPHIPTITVSSSLTQTNTPIETIRSLSGQIVKVKGTISDILQMEMFAAVYPDPAQTSSTDLYKSNFFSECQADIVDQVAEGTTLFYERTPAVLQIQQPVFDSKKRPQLSLSTIYSLPNEKHQELNQKLVNRELEVPLIIKIYGNEEYQRENHIQINSFVEIIGFLYSSNSTQAESATDPAEGNQQVNMGLEAFEIDHYLNNWFAPSIHALSIRKLAPYEHEFEEYANLTAPTLEVVSSLKEYFRNACLGDNTAADLIFYSMLSYVTSRPQQYPIDCLSLNVYDIKNPKIITNLVSLLQLVSPYIITQEVTLKDLGCEKWYGKKNYDMNCIENGKLFAPNGGLILLDESRLETGKIHEVGVKNASYITDIVQNQKAYYDFDYFSFSAETNLTVISLSLGKSIFGFEYRVNLFQHRSLSNRSPPPIQWILSSNSHLQLS